MHRLRWGINDSNPVRSMRRSKDFVMSPDIYYRNSIQEAKCSYAMHVLRATTDTSWLLGAEGSSVNLFWISIMGPYVVLVGDLRTCVFRRGYAASPKAMVQWVCRADLHYLSETCRSAMDHHSGYTWDSNIARFELDGYSLDPDGYFTARDRVVYKNAQEYVDAGCTALQRYLESNLSDPTDMPLHDIGRVVSPRVIYARAACRRLAQIIGNEDS